MEITYVRTYIKEQLVIYIRMAFLLCFIRLWINFYNLRYITKVTPLPEPKRSDQYRQKQFVQKSLHCFIEPPVVTLHTKFC